MKRMIVLELTGEGIMAHWFNTLGEPDNEIVDLFGTHIIPTPFIGGASMPTAFETISKLNPDHEVNIL